MRASFRLIPLLLLLTAGLAALMASSCGVMRGPPTPRAALSPDSMEVLQRALLRVRPAYPTQRQALRAGLYGEVEPIAVREHVPSGTPDPPPARPGVTQGWVIQVAAYDSRAEAEQAERRLRAEFFDRTTRIERGPGVYRLALGPWDRESDAEHVLRSVRRRYPDAWIRRAGATVR